MPKQRKYTDDDIKNAVASSRSYAQVLAKIGLKPAGGNYKVLQTRLKTLSVSTDHFRGCGWNCGKDFKSPKKSTPLEKILVKNSSYTQTYKLKRRLFDAGLKKNVCELCGISEWQHKPLAMHLDHINGENSDNRLENLRILCPNCHAQTPTYCGRNWGKSGT